MIAMSENESGVENEKGMEIFDGASEKIFSVIETFIREDYKERLAKLAVYLGEERGRKVIESLPEKMRDEVLGSFSTLIQNGAKRTDEEIISEAEDALEKSHFFGRTMVDEVLGKCLFGETEELLSKKDQLSEKNPVLVRGLEQFCFTISNIVMIGDRDVQKILREVDSSTLATAMKNVDPEVQDKIFRNMSKRAASMLKEDMEFIGHVSKATVVDAQEKIVQVIKRLEEMGEIVIASNLEDYI